MLEDHYCAHPLRPGYASGPASREGIRESRWSSSRMYLYSYCKNKSGLASRKTGTKGRWELWARSAHNLIPILKQQLEWSWRANKRCDSKKKNTKSSMIFCIISTYHVATRIVWISVSKLAPLCHRKLNRLLIDTGRYRELPSWRKGFREEWRKLEKKKPWK